MASPDVLLSKSAEHISAIQAMYGTLTNEVKVTDDLLYLVRSTLQDQLSALDWIAHEIDQRYGKATKRSPYFPLYKSPSDFTDAFNQHYGAVVAARPDIRDAFERHQPYQPHHEILEHLHKLANVNKHQDFTPQEKIDGGFMGMFANGQLIMSVDPRHIRIGGWVEGQLVEIQRAQSNDPRFEAIQARIIDWNFVDPPLSVQTTLHRTQSAVVATVDDIRHVADL